jgi:hypothetical protein
MPLLTNLVDPPREPQNIAIVPKAAEKVQTLLKEAGLKGKKKSVNDLLDEYDINTESAIELLSEIAKRGETDAIRLRAIDTALKLSGDLTETPQVPIVNIIINDSEATFEVNPILIPR